jgi:hypothetical protein
MKAAPGRLICGKGQGLGVGDREDGDLLVGATVLVADSRVDAPLGDAACGVEPLLALLLATWAVGDVACQQGRRRRGAADGG